MYNNNYEELTDIIDEHYPKWEFKNNEPEYFKHP